MRSLKDVRVLANGTKIPCVGFGTWRVAEGAEEIIRSAIDCGYRHIDSAAAYGNEEQVGEAVRNCGIKREELFVTSKLWKDERGYDRALAAFDESMKRLGLEYLDLYLIHWPCVSGDWQSINASTWRALERIYNEGRVKSIGVSNFLVHHLQELLPTAQITPMVNQIEFHPGFMRHETVDFCRQNNILVEAWGPMGTGRILDNPILAQYAAKYGKTPAQICIRWCLQNEVVPLPKSSKPHRIKENADVFDFEISAQDMAELNALPFIGGLALNPDQRG